MLNFSSLVLLTSSPYFTSRLQVNYHSFSALTLLVFCQEEHMGYKKFLWWGAGVAICLKWGAGGLHVVQLMPLPSIVSCFIKIQIGAAILVPAYPGCPRKKAVKRGCFLCSRLIMLTVCCLSRHSNEDVMKLIPALVEFIAFLWARYPTCYRNIGVKAVNKTNALTLTSGMAVSFLHLQPADRQSGRCCLFTSFPSPVPCTVAT